MDTDKTDVEKVSDLKERVDKFHFLALPGQPKMMHMGTSHLVSDLWQRIAELEAQQSRQSQSAQGWYPPADAQAFENRIAELEAQLSRRSWTAMKVNGLQQVFPSEDGLYEQWDGRDLTYAEWPIKEEGGYYEWMGVTHFHS